jgi:hypothetical protein
MNINTNSFHTHTQKKEEENFLSFFVLSYWFFISMYRKIQEWDCSQVKNRFGTIGMRERDKEKTFI